MGLFNRSKKASLQLDETPKPPNTKSFNSSIKFNKNKVNDFMIKAVGGVMNQSDARERFKRPEYNL